jgi:arylsulfatase A-like enzyme
MNSSNPNRWTRREFLGTVAGATAAVSLPDFLHAATSKSTRKPNVLFIVSDDLRVELGCYDSLFHAKTQNLDALARSGVRFDRAYCQFPLCNPSRASLLTGLNPARSGVLGNRAHIRTAHPDCITLPQTFKEKGYVTVRAGKIFHGGYDDAKSWTDVTDSGGPTDDGSDAPVGRTREIPRARIPQPDGVLPPLPADTGRAAYSDRIVVLEGDGEGHGDYNVAERTIANLRRYKDEPFFIACGFVKPHSPQTAPQRFLDLYDVNRIELTPDFAAWPTVPPGFPGAAIRKRNADLFIGRGASEAEAKEVIRAYLASTSWMDWNVGRVMAELDKLGLRDNTIVVFLGDNGYQLGEKGKWSKAGSLFEMGTRVPLMIASPGATGNGRTSRRIVELLDIYPTLVELCGLPKNSEIDGQSLVPLLNKPSAKWDKPGFSVWSEDGKTFHGVSVRTEKWRYAEFGPNGVNGAMLFDAKKDPFEMKNLANDSKYKSVCAELSSLTRKYAAALGGP